MRNGAAYIRVSTTDQSELSPDAQKRLIKDYANKNNIMIKEENIFIDEGISGRKAEKRPAFMKMIATAKIKPRPFDIILVHKLDRFSRSREDSIVYKSLLRKECGIQVLSISEQLEDDKFSVILEAMLEAMAEYYSLNLSEEVTKGMTEKALRGGFQARPPLGYRLEHSGTIPVIVPEEAYVVKKIFTMYVNEKKSLLDICRYLNQLGIKTKANNPFEKRSIQYILENPIYIGKLRWNRMHNATNTMKDESEWIIKKGQLEPIIDDRLYTLAIQRLSNESKHLYSPKSNYKHYLSGLLKCSNCGRTLVVTTRVNHKTNREYRSFQCYGYLKGICNVSHQISESKIIHALLRELEELFVNEKDNYQPSVSKFDYSSEISLLKLKLSKLDNKEERIRSAYISGIDSLSEYETSKQAIKEERNNIESELAHLLENSSSPVFTTIDNPEKLFALQNPTPTISNVSDVIKSDSFSASEKNLVLRSILDKIIYNKNENSLTFYYHLK